MTLRSEIEALLVEFDHFAYDGAPLDVAVEKLREILAKTAPRVLTTEDELNSGSRSPAVTRSTPGGSPATKPNTPPRNYSPISRPSASNRPSP